MVVCVCVCVGSVKKKRNRDRERERERDRKRSRDRDIGELNTVFIFMLSSLYNSLSNEIKKKRKTFQTLFF